MNNYKVKDKSTITSAEGIFYYVVINFIFFINYKDLLFVPLITHVSKECYILLGACMLITSMLGLIVRWKRCLRYRTVITDSLAGIGIYTSLSYWEYYPKLIVILIVVFVIAFGLIVLKNGSLCRTERKMLRIDYAFLPLILKNHCFKILHSSGMVLGILTLILLIPISYNRLCNKDIVIADSKIERIVESRQSIDYGLEAKFRSISKLRYEETWNPLTSKEKVNVLQDLCDCEAAYWGMEDTVTVKTDDLGGLIRGYYCDAEKVVCIDKALIEEGTPESVMQTTLHEMFHAWEHALTRLYVECDDAQRKLLVFNHCEDYLKEINNYTTGLEDDSNYLAYYYQVMEVDAREYSFNAVEEYYTQIDELAKNE